MNDMWDEDNCGIYLLQGDVLEYDELEDIKRQVQGAAEDLANSFDMG